MHRLSAVIAAAALAFTLLGCVHRPTGPEFSTPGSPQSNHALVYFYRPSNETAGYDIAYPLFINHTKLTDILYGGYYPFEPPSGHLEIVAGNKPASTAAFLFPKLLLGPVGLAFAAADTSALQDQAQLDLDVNAGHIYFIKFHPDVHPNHFTPRLFAVPVDEAEREMVGCKLLDPAP